MDFKKPAITAILLGFLLFLEPHGALAASGGRMGGRASSSSSRRSSSSSLRYRHRINHYHRPTSHREVEFNASGRGDEFNASSRGEEFNVKPAGCDGDCQGFCVLIMMLLMAILVLVLLFDCKDDDRVATASPKTSVIKLQVGLLGLARSFQKDLDRIANVADTSTLRGLSYILTETTLALLRHPDYCISAYSSVTILVVADGVHELLEINSRADLKETLQKLASIPPSKTRAVEVLWTPQKKNDALSKRPYLGDYPLLRPL